MSGREQGRARLAVLAKQVREVLSNDGEQIIHRRGVEAMVELAQDLTGPEAPPGLMVQRDGGLRLKLLRKDRPGLITLSWERAIGALVGDWERLDKKGGPFRFTFRETESLWREMDSGEELYTWLTDCLAEVLYPDSKKAP
jgi:hypothetical protein